MIAYAKTKGANGINLVGCAAPPMKSLMRHGIPIGGNFLQQELAIVTGAVEAMVVDVQCIMQGLTDVAQVLPYQTDYHRRKSAYSPARLHIHFDDPESRWNRQKLS